MFNTIQKLSLFFALIMLIYMGYEGFFKDSAQAWENFEEPQLAAYTSLEEDEQILEQLEEYTHFSGHKSMDPSFFVRANVSVFRKIEGSLGE